MPAVIVVILLGGQTLFRDVSRAGLVAIGASLLGGVARSPEGPSIGMAGLGPTSLVDFPRGRAWGRGA